MDPYDVKVLFALLAILAQLGTIAILLAGIARVFGAAGMWNTFKELLEPFGLFPPFVVALTCMLGSLYLSEIDTLVPCKFCWFQRIAMYSLAIILGVAAFRKDNHVRVYAYTLAGIGLPFSIWHMLLEKFPDLEGGLSCDVLNPCSTIVFQWHYLTVPTMAASGFAFVIALLIVGAPARAQTTTPVE